MISIFPVNKSVRSQNGTWTVFFINTILTYHRRIITKALTGANRQAPLRWIDDGGIIPWQGRVPVPASRSLICRHCSPLSSIRACPQHGMKQSRLTLDWIKSILKPGRSTFDMFLKTLTDSKIDQEICNWWGYFSGWSSMGT
jgi:hypothetical protein